MLIDVSSLDELPSLVVGMTVAADVEVADNDPELEAVDVEVGELSDAEDEAPVIVPLPSSESSDAQPDSARAANAAAAARCTELRTDVAAPQ